MEDYKARYEQALRRAKKFWEAEYKGVAEEIFPELKESEDERIRKALIKYYSFDKDGGSHVLDNITPKQILDWLEKQVPINEEAEKEKNDYVSGQFLYCKGSFNEFKEGESYWIEYIGNDTYIGRSDNILNQKFHITPRQLYTWLDPRHPEKQNEQKPTDKVEPKFKVGDWVVYTGHLLKDSGMESYVMQVKSIEDGRYNFTDTSTLLLDSEKYMRLWTFQDAKDGDVLCYKDEISLYRHDIKSCTKQETTFGGFVYYCCYDGKRFVVDSLYSLTEQDRMDIHPATKEQRDALMKAMTDAGYTFDFEKKELKKIEEPENYKRQVMSEMTDLVKYYITQKPTAWSKEDDEMLDSIIEEVRYIGDFPDYPTKEENELYDECLAKVEWLKSLKYRVHPQPKQEWSEEDGEILDGIIVDVEVLKEQDRTKDGKVAYQKEIDWLKSLRPKNTQQIPVWRYAFSVCSESGKPNEKDLFYLSEDKILVKVPKGSTIARCLLIEELEKLPKEEEL